MLGVIVSTQVVLYTLFGGVGTLIGAVIGVIGIEVFSFTSWPESPLPGDLADPWVPCCSPVILLRPSGLISLVVPERERIGNFEPRRRRRAVGH